MTGATPITLPISAALPRKASVQTFGDIIGGRGQRFLVVELTSQAEADAITDWLGQRMPPQSCGGPL